MAVRGWFGALIGNSDMHLGHASLVLAAGRPLALAPSYDRLPMALRPASTGEVVTRMLDLPLPVPEQQAHWRGALPMALDFWRQATDHAGISSGFRRIASEQADKLAAVARRFD